MFAANPAHEPRVYLSKEAETDWQFCQPFQSELEGVDVVGNLTDVRRLGWFRLTSFKKEEVGQGSLSAFNAAR
jgi:hypothetical protein